MDKPKAIFSWSGGKDSSYSLYKVIQEDVFDVKYLLTSVNQKFKRISMHGVREELLELQTQLIGIPQLKVYVNEGTNKEYEHQMEALLLNAKREGIEFVIFGDIFLEDLRLYRENNLARVGMKAIFPIWKTDTTSLIQDFLNKGFKTITCCVNDAFLDEQWVGREVNRAFVSDLPAHVDPCGENGEYHSFCFEGPIFKQKISYTLGEKIYKQLDMKIDTDSDCNKPEQTKGFWYVDLIPNN